MELTPELLGSAAVGVIVILGALGNYLASRKARPHDSVLTGIGMEFSNREQTERLIEQVKRIADALTDKNSAHINNRLEELADRFDAMQTPPRRRP